MEYFCIKCGTEMKRARVTIYGGISIQNASAKPHYGGDSNVLSYCCPNCGFIEYYAEKPEIFK